MQKPLEAELQNPEQQSALIAHEPPSEVHIPLLLLGVSLFGVSLFGVSLFGVSLLKPGAP
jgi:hypothetical protein